MISLWITSHDHGYKSDRWATFRQWQELDASVEKGQKGTRIVFYKPLTVEDRDTGEERSIPMLRYSTVFNAEQLSSPDRRADEDKPAELPNGVTLEDGADSIILETGAKISYGGDRAYYAPASDSITLPELEQFKSTGGYYSTAFHELGHWTGHKSRLDRQLEGRFGDEKYAAEELIAELTAAFTLGAIGMSSEPREDHAKYVANWLTILKRDKKAIFTAAARAATAADYIRKVEREEPAKVEEPAYTIRDRDGKPAPWKVPTAA